jgi:hypothetical protein
VTVIDGGDANDGGGNDDHHSGKIGVTMIF